jgi:hypothetical protein
MYNRYADFEELHLTGEASHVPDVMRNEGCDGDRRRQCVAPTTGESPDAPAPTDGECRSCGTSMPAGKTTCRFCLTNHLGDDTTRTAESMETAHLGIGHRVVESTTFYGAVARGGRRDPAGPSRRARGRPDPARRRREPGAISARRPSLWDG